MPKATNECYVSNIAWYYVDTDFTSVKMYGDVGNSKLRERRTACCAHGQSIATRGGGGGGGGGGGTGLMLPPGKHRS